MRCCLPTSLLGEQNLGICLEDKGSVYRRASAQDPRGATIPKAGKYTGRGRPGLGQRASALQDRWAASHCAAHHGVPSCGPGT